MKKMILFLILVISYTTITKAQKVYSVEYASQADIKVFVTDYESRADLSVYKVDYSSQAGKNDGNWFFVDYASQADVKSFLWTMPHKLILSSILLIIVVGQDGRRKRKCIYFINNKLSL